MCGANRSHSNKTTSRKFRKSVDSVSGPRTELNIMIMICFDLEAYWAYMSIYTFQIRA